MSKGRRKRPEWSYDAIADVYATDMGQSMPFDDVGWYRSLCERGRGRILELGCGTGRILIALLRAGLDAVGADRSLPMLRRLRRDGHEFGLRPQLAQMDLTSLALSGASFRTILLPYSLITYVTQAEAARTAMAAIASLLEPGGRIVLDAFAPKAVESFADFRLDYRRPHGTGLLERRKRITANADGTNRIERRYRLLDALGALQHEFLTDETIRPYAEHDLLALAADSHLTVDRCSYDYDAWPGSDAPRFVTLVLRHA